MKLKIASTALFVLFTITVCTIMPLAAIWALNTLFSLSIPYTFWSWLAMVVLAVFAKTGITTNK